MILKDAQALPSAPDLIDYARNHLMCVNLSLFGNTENAFESTFFYFVNSFNIGHPNDTLVENLLKSTGLAAQDPAALQNQIDAYKNIFMQKMQQAGGGLMQVFMKKDVVDSYGYACWAKGVPYYMTKDRAQFAVRNNHNLKALPILSDQTKALYRPKLSEMLDLYKSDLKAFAKLYSYDDNSLLGADRFQARLIINPNVFMDKDKVTIVRTFRNAVAKQDHQEYRKNLKTQIRQDFTDAIAEQRLTKDFFSYNFALAKIVKFVLGRSQTSFSDVMGVIKNSSKGMLRSTIKLSHPYP